MVLFGAASGYDLDDAQLALVQWARWYKSVYEMPASDRPDDRLIANDEALDRWFERYQRDAARKARRSPSAGGDATDSADRIPTFRPD